LPFVSTLILHTPMLTLFPYTTLFRSCGSKAKSRRFASCILTSWILTVEIPDLCVVGYASPLYDRLRLFLIEVNSMPGVRNRNGKDRKSTRLNSSHVAISYAVFCLKKK